MLTDDDLRDIDKTLLTYLVEGRISPAYGRKRLEEEGEGEYSRGYVQQRLARFEEHGHLTNLYGVGLYELDQDPRDREGQD
jgi:hypothetical protein